MSLSRAVECVSMRLDQLRQSIRTFPALAHIRIIKCFDLADVGQTTLPALHPWMRRWRACSWRENNQTFHRFFRIRRGRSSWHPCHLDSGKNSWDDVRDEVHQAMADHVGCQVATP